MRSSFLEQLAPWLSLALLASSSGCPQPPQGMTPDQDHGQGRAPQPEGGDPSPPPPASPAAPGRAAPEPLDIQPGQGVELSGTVSYAGSTQGQLRLEVLLRRERGSAPTLLVSEPIGSEGTWSTTLPRQLGRVRVLSYIDTDDDGPSPGEPRGEPERVVFIGDDPIAGLDIVVRDPSDPAYRSGNKRQGQGKGRRGRSQPAADPG
jgi:hypothetical protein